MGELRMSGSTWISIDFDDLRHLPKHSGHPTRSKKPHQTSANKELSGEFQRGMVALEKWLNSNDFPVTFFIIADLFENPTFTTWLQAIISQFSQRITIGNHGLTHRSWSAWPEDIVGFEQALIDSNNILQQYCGANLRPWFRAPAGYIAPWMAPILAKNGFEVDSSVNPSWLLKRKTGKDKSWSKVIGSMKQNGIREIAWKTKWSLPINGPALHIPILKRIAKREWRNSPVVDCLDDCLKSDKQITALYWHLLDHSRNEATWSPPLQ